MYNYLRDELSKVASKHGERLLDTKNNPISMGEAFRSDLFRAFLLRFDRSRAHPLVIRLEISVSSFLSFFIYCNLHFFKNIFFF